MKFPSLKTLAESAVNTIKRYPFEVFFALIGTIAAIIEIELRHHSRESESWCMRVIMTANLGFLLSLSATLYAQSKELAARKKLLIKIAAAVIAATTIFIIDPAQRQADYTRFFLLSLSFHLLVAFAAFTGKGQVQGFWQFNKTLFLRFLTSALYGVVLFLGLAAAIGATNFLFNFEFEWDTYAILWAIIAGLFTTIFFLAGVPAETGLLNEDESYPKGLKIFTQYVLIPLSTVYVLILLAYEIKIIIEWQLPKGLVSDLILSYSVFGILSLLLVYPVRGHNENKWLKTYARSFYFLLIPLLGLLFVAVSARVFSYGITEFRYFLILLAFWLLFISVYFLLFKQQNIKLIPISLCVLTLLTIYGPQSAFTVSMYSQRRIVLRFFEKHNAFKDGKLMPVDSTKISNKEGSKGVNNLQYFIYNYDLKPLQPYLNKNLETVTDSLGKQVYKYSDFAVDREELREEKYNWAKKYLGLNHFDLYYSSYNDSLDLEKNYSFTINENITVVKGYDITLDNDQSADSVINNYNGIKIMEVNTNNLNFLKINNETFKFESVGIVKTIFADSVKLESYRNKAAPDGSYSPKQYNLPSQLMLLTQETPAYKVTFRINKIEFTKPVKKPLSITYVLGSYLIKIK